MIKELPYIFFVFIKVVFLITPENGKKRLLWGKKWFTREKKQEGVLSKNVDIF